MVIQNPNYGYMFFLVTDVNAANTWIMFYYCSYMLLIKTLTSIEPAAELQQNVGSSWCSIICSEEQSGCLL